MRRAPPGRGSRVMVRPIQRRIRSGSVKYGKTVSGRASTRTSRSTVVAVGSAAGIAFLLFGHGGQSRQAVVPERLEPGAQLARAVGSGAVPATGAVPPLDDEAGVPKHGQVL